MHLPDSILTNSVCTITLVSGAAAFGTATYISIKKAKETKALRVGLVTALIFAFQMLNFPIGSGISGHFIGAAFAVATLGFSFGLFSMGMVVLIQALFFGDGGISAFGANFINMALIPGMLTFYTLKLFNSHKTSGFKYLIYFLVSFTSVIAASFACGLTILPVSGYGAAITSKAMVLVHSKIALGEALITTALLFRVRSWSEKETYKKANYEMLLITGIAIFISPFASSFPDGLEYCADKLLYITTGFDSIISGIMPDYSFSAIDSTYFSTLVAGFFGVIITMIFSSLAVIKNR